MNYLIIQKKYLCRTLEWYVYILNFFPKKYKLHVSKKKKNVSRDYILFNEIIFDISYTIISFYNNFNRPVGNLQFFLLKKHALKE